MTNILSQVLKISKLKVPLALAFHNLSRTQHFGTKSATEYLKDDVDLTRALKVDTLSLCSRNSLEPLLTTNIEMTEKERALRYFKTCFKSKDIPRLPASLELLNAKEVLIYLRTLIHCSKILGRQNLGIGISSTTSEPIAAF